jgi:hypothetical protein
VWAPLGSTTNVAAVAGVGALVCGAWGFLTVTGSIETIWPLFGVANQLLAVIALAVGTTFLLRQRPSRYAWVTLGPLCFLTVSTMTAGVLNTFRYLSPAYIADKGPLIAYLDGILSVVLLLLVAVVLVDAVRRWIRILALKRSGHTEIPLATEPAPQTVPARLPTPEPSLSSASLGPPARPKTLDAIRPEPRERPGPWGSLKVERATGSRRCLRSSRPGPSGLRSRAPRPRCSRRSPVRIR